MQGEYDKAWSYLVEANRLQRDTYSFNPEASSDSRCIWKSQIHPSLSVFLCLPALPQAMEQHSAGDGPAFTRLLI